MVRQVMEHPGLNLGVEEYYHLVTYFTDPRVIVKLHKMGPDLKERILIMTRNWSWTLKRQSQVMKSKISSPTSYMEV